MEETTAVKERLIAFGVSGEAIKPRRRGLFESRRRRGREHRILPEDLEVTSEADPKKDWVMHDLREEDEQGRIYRLQELEADLLLLDGESRVRLGRGFLKGLQSEGVYLGFVKGIDHPVIIKKLRRSRARNLVAAEIYTAQLFSIIGVSPKFYGLVKTEDGSCAYAMQVAGGKFELNSLVSLSALSDCGKIVAERLSRYKVGASFQTIVSSRKFVAVIDAGDASLAPGIAFKYTLFPRDEDLYRAVNELLQTGRVGRQKDQPR